ncbi:MFS transporter [Mycobacterium simiae]|uniref:MFS transporter n=1 Tax=Mycobacterium simiae TaxID=1784 RepID=A0A5B1BRX3_MYCSI|nr:MFS transporter [Mycobacterium simiae]KAA1250083.1 MFS transporter [Mycobacterium simiae]
MAAPYTQTRSAHDTLTFRQWMTVLAMGLGFAITGADPTIFSSNLVPVREGLHMSTAAAGFTASLATLMLAATILAAGTLGDIYGKRRMYLFGLVGVIVGGLLAAVSLNAVMLMVTRALTGVCFAFLLGLSLAIINAVFPPAQRAKAISLFLGTAFLVAAPLPLVGNVLVESLGWRWALLVAPAAALLTIPITLRFVPETFCIRGRRIDYPGIAAAGLMLVSLVYGLSRLSHGPAAAALPLLIGLAAGTFFVWWEQRTDQPALDLRIFRAGPFNAAVITGCAFNFLMAGLILVLSYYATVVRGYSPTVLGLLLVLGAATQAPSAVLAGRLMMRTSARATMLSGLGLLALAAVVFATFGVQTSLVVIGLGMVTLSAGAGLVEPPQASVMMSYASPGLEGSVAAVKPGAGQSFYSLGPTVVTLLTTTFYAARAGAGLAGTGVSPAQAADALEASRARGAGHADHVGGLSPDLAHRVLADTQEIIISALHTTSLILAVIPLVAAVAVWLLIPRNREDHAR